MVPNVHDEKGRGAVAELGQQVGPLVDTYVAALEARKLKDGIRIAMAISSVGEPLCPAIHTTIGAVAFCLCLPSPILLHRDSHSCACWLHVLPLDTTLLPPFLFFFFTETVMVAPVGFMSKS